MAYLNEFPHTEASKLNLDWILEQYSTFNERLAEIVQHFDESVAQMESDILQFKGEYETAFNNYKSDINHLMEDFEQLVNQEVQQVSNAIEQVNRNITVYLEENLPTLIENDQTIHQEIVNIAKVNVISENVTTGTTPDSSPYGFGLYTGSVTINKNIGKVTNICIVDMSPTIGSGRSDMKFVMNDSQLNVGIAYPFFRMEAIDSTHCSITIYGESNHLYRIQYIDLP